MKGTVSMRINRRMQDILPSSTLAITARAKELKAQGFDVVNFAAGEPDFDTPEDIKNAAIKAIQDGFTKYTPSTGTPQLKEAIAVKFQKDNGLAYKPSQIVVSCGAKHALFNIIQVLAGEGEEVLLPVPFWVSYPEMVKMAGADVKMLATSAATSFKVTARQLENAITEKSKIFILNSPSNPTGSVYSRQELEDIAGVCVKHQLFVISDEIYEKLIYEVESYTSIASLGKDIYDLTITVNGVSKAYSMTGWRIGYCAGPEEIMEYMKRFQDHSTSNPASISQMAAIKALQSSPENIKAMRDEFRRRRDVMMAACDRIKEISYIRPQGAFYLFCDISRVGRADDIARRILDEAHVALIPGEGFGAPGYVRLSFATSIERIEEGIKRISRWIQKEKSAVK